MRSTILALAASLILTAGARAEPQEVLDRLDSSRQAPLAGVWLGEFRQYDPGRFWSYPMRLEVDEDAGGRVSGTIHWTSLSDSVTTFQGTRDGTLLRFTEPTLIQGKDIVLGGAYLASFRNPDLLEGTWAYPKEPARFGFGTFVLHRTALPRRRLSGEGWLGR